MTKKAIQGTTKKTKKTTTKKGRKVTLTISSPKLSPIQLMRELKLERENKPKRRQEDGRPYFNGRSEEIVVALLCEAWAKDATDLQACVHAGISEAALYRYREKNPDLRELKRYYKQKFMMEVKDAHVRDLSNPYTRGATAKWILERREPKRYNLTQKVQMGEDRENPFGGTLLDAMLALKKIDAKKKVQDVEPVTNSTKKLK